MSLTEILSDINENTENIDTTNIVVKNTQHITLEQNTQNTTDIAIKTISKETINNINNMFNLITIQSNIKDISKVDYSIAQEVFTMLPNISKHEAAKLTTAPSAMNKEILDKVFNLNIDTKLDANTTENLYNLSIIIQNNLYKFEEIYTYIKSFKDLIKDKIETLEKNPPIVIWINYSIDDNKHKKVNLFTEPIDNIVIIDDTKLEYEKYSNTLTNMYRNLYRDETLEKLVNLEKSSNLQTMSLNSFIHMVEGLITSLKIKETSLRKYIDTIASLSSDDRTPLSIDSKTLNMINKYEDLVYMIEYVNSVYSIIKTDNNCFDKVNNLISFLD